MTDAKLKSLVERIERLMDERDGLGEDIRDVFTEVKSAGYVPKVLRKVIVRRRMDPDKRAEEDSWQEMYESALDGPTRKAVEMAAAGATLREIEAETGIKRSTAERFVPPKKDRGTPKGEAVASVLTADATVGGEDSRPPAPPANSVEQGDRQSPLRDGEASADITTASALPSPPSAGVHTQFYGGAPVVEDDLAIPAHLRRARA
jgi:uncharacterized protein (UPF0335 family)